MRVISAIVAWLLLASAPSWGQAGNEGFSAEVERKLAEIGAPEVPGYSYAVVEAGKITEIGQWGVLRLGASDPVRPETPFLIGSISKSFTALAIMQMVEAGDLDLDTPVSVYLTEFQGTPAGDPTLRQLLSHTSGFSTVQGNASQGDRSMASDALARRVAALKDIDPASRPGEKWEYSNANYQLLGRVIEIVSGESYSDYIESRILRPAGMRDSYVHRWPAPEGAADGHMPWFGGHRPMEGNRTGLGSAPQGGIVASARDLARYLALMMNGEDDLISAAGKAQMMQPASPVSANYGLGWFVNAQERLVFHSGSNPGHESLATMRPDEKKGVVVLSNAVSGIAFSGVAETLYGISSVALDLPYEGENKTTLQLSVAALVFIAAFFAGALAFSWRRRNRPRNTKRFAQAKAWLAVILALGLAAMLVFALPASFGATFAAVSAFQPDLALLLGTTAGLAVTWAILKIALEWRKARRSVPNS